MVESNHEEIEQIERKAKNEDRDAKNAANMVSEAVSHMNPQRQYDEDKSENKR